MQDSRADDKPGELIPRAGLSSSNPRNWIGLNDPAMIPQQSEAS